MYHIYMDCNRLSLLPSSVGNLTRLGQPYSLHPTPCTLHPAPYTLPPTTQTLHPTTFTLRPRAGSFDSGFGV